MPEDSPGEMTTEAYTDIVAYLLSVNDYQVGDTHLDPTHNAMTAIQLGAGARKTPK